MYAILTEASIKFVLNGFLSYLCVLQTVLPPNRKDSTLVLGSKWKILGKWSQRERIKEHWYSGPNNLYTCCPLSNAWIPILREAAHW